MNTIEKVNELIDKTCAYYQIDRKYLNKNNKEKPPKVFIDKDKELKVSLSNIRMALSFFIYKYSDIPIAVLSPMVGYTDHSTLSANKSKIINYLDTNDHIFMPYWNTIVMLAKDIDFDLSMQRVFYSNKIRMKKSVNIY